MFLKPLDKVIHRRIHGAWQGLPRFDPLRQLWYGTTDWMKAVPTAAAAYGADVWENVTHPFDRPQTPTQQPPGAGSRR